MSYQSDFDAWKDQIEGLPLEETKQPNEAIDVCAAKSESIGE